MRVRSGWTLPAVLLAGFALVLPSAAALGSPASSPAHSTPTVRAGVPAARLGIGRHSSVTLPTGQQVRLTGRAGHEHVLVAHPGPAGPVRALVTRRLRSHVYAMPAVADPYLGRFLDPNLFDVTRLSAARTGSRRIGVRIAYRGPTPAVPGVRVTSAASGLARGYLTSSSADTFGRALTAQWRADSRAGWPRRSTLFGSTSAAGVTRISADVAPPGVVKPAYPMYTLVIKTVGADGKPQPFGSLALLNVDNGNRFAAFVAVENGEARVSVPKGRYGAIAEDLVYNEKAGTGSLRVAIVNQFRVTGAGQTLRLDYRTATARPSVTVPQPTDLVDYSLEWDRVDAAEVAFFAAVFDVGPNIALGVTPTAKTTVGTTDIFHTFVLAGRTPAVNPDSYTVATHQRLIPANPHFTFRAADFGVLHSAYYGDGSTKRGGILRFPSFAASLFGGGSFDPVTRGARRTEYVAANERVSWTDGALVNYDALDDPGFMDGPTRTIPARHTVNVSWFRGPLAAAIPPASDFNFCYICRSGNHIEVGLAPYTDSDPAHVGELWGAEDGLPVARFRFYRNGKLVSDHDDYLGGDFVVSRRKATYRAVLDVDRRLMEPAQSTQSQTELTFSSAKNTGKKLPNNWYCDGTHCRVLSIVQARVALATDLQGRLPAGRSNVTVTVAAAPPSARSPITGATLAVRFAGWGWSSVPLTPVGGGRYTGVLNNRKGAGSAVDVRVTAKDKAGSAFRQTILRAYRVSPS